MDVGTDPLEMQDKEVQFGFGDETDLLNIIACIQSRRESRGRDEIRDEGKDVDSNDKKRKKKRDQTSSLLEESGVLVDRRHARAVAENSLEGAFRLKRTQLLTHNTCFMFQATLHLTAACHRFCSALPWSWSRCW